MPMPMPMPGPGPAPGSGPGPGPSPSRSPPPVRRRWSSWCARPTRSTSSAATPWSPPKSLADAWISATALYDLSVIGRNGFLRRFMGSILADGPGLQVQETDVRASRTIVLSLFNGNTAAISVLVTGIYSGNRVEIALASGGTVARSFPLAATSGWYDLVVTAPEQRSPRLRQQSRRGRPGSVASSRSNLC